MILHSGRLLKPVSDTAGELVNVIAQSLGKCCSRNTAGLTIRKSVRITGITFEEIEEARPAPRIHAFNLATTDVVDVASSNGNGSSDPTTHHDRLPEDMIE